MGPRPVTSASDRHEAKNRTKPPNKPAWIANLLTSKDSFGQNQEISKRLRPTDLSA